MATTQKKTVSAPKTANTAKKRITFNLNAPEAQEVSLAGSFNEWDPAARALKCDRKGIWRTWLNLTPGQHEYRFIVNGQWQEDPRCDDRQENPYGSFNSIVEV